MTADDQTYNIDKSEPLPWETGQESSSDKTAYPSPPKDQYRNFDLEDIKRRIAEWKKTNKGVVSKLNPSLIGSDS